MIRLFNVKDRANGFAGIFAENQSNVAWSVTSASGFSFTSNPGDFSTSVPEVPDINGVTVPLNFFAQVGFERNGIFFPAGLTSPISAAGGINSPVPTVSSALAFGGVNPAFQDHHAMPVPGEAKPPLPSAVKAELSGHSDNNLAMLVGAAKNSTFEYDWDPIVTRLVS